jgi:hypothetical protein
MHMGVKMADRFYCFKCGWQGNEIIEGLEDSDSEYCPKCGTENPEEV